MRRIALLTGFLALLGTAAGPARADAIEVRDAALRAAEDGLVLDADFAFELTPRLAEVVANGVPLYFRVEFELTRRRWYWFDERSASSLLQMRLSYHALSRHYRLSTGLQQQNLLQQNFATLEEALNVLKLLPKPFQLSALTSRELHLESPWKRFVVRSPQQLPAPVESREPKRPEGR